MKRLYICFYADDEWISGIVANSHKQAKKIFYKIYRGTSGDDYTEWIDIRVILSRSDVDISKLSVGEIDSDWGLKNGIYSELY